MKIKKLFKKDWFQTIITSIICCILGLIVGYIVLLFINPEHAFNDGIIRIIQGFFSWPTEKLQLKYFGYVLSHSVPLFIAGLSILFAYKTGLFNIGASGQYVMGATAAISFALLFKLPWYLCLFLGSIAGALYGTVVGLLKAFLNINEVISGIMLNWIGLYIANIILTSSDTIYNISLNESNSIAKYSPSSLLPNAGLDEIFHYNNINISIYICILLAIIIFVILNFTTFGYELKATGSNKNAAKYSGMKEKMNIILTLAISGALAGLSGAIFYLSNFEVWRYPTSVPSMGFDGISAAFLGGLSPIGTIFSSFFISYIQYGGNRLSTEFFTAEAGTMISSAIIYFCAFVTYMKLLLNKHNSKNKKEDK